MPEHLERAGVLFATGTAERIDSVTDLDRLEPGLLQQLPPACARQATSNSSRPEIDIADRGLGNWLAVGDNVQNRLEKGKGGDAMKKGKGKDKK
jgi:hypothetical protein